MKTSHLITPLSHYSLFRGGIALLLILMQVVMSPEVLIAAESYRIEQAKAGEEKAPKPNKAPKKLKKETQEESKYTQVEKEIMGMALFEERLMPMGEKAFSKKEREEQSEGLKRAIEDYESREDVEALEALENYLGEYPQSEWAVSLWVNMALIYKKHGSLSRARESLEKAWERGKGIKEVGGKMIVDRGLGELGQLLMGMGKREEFESLVKEIQGRKISGVGQQKLLGAKESWYLEQREQREKGQRQCGFEALSQIIKQKAPGQKIGKIAFGEQGSSLRELQRVMREAGLNYQAIYQEKKEGQGVPNSSVVHCRSGHYLAILGSKEVGGKKWYQTDKDRWISQRALEDEMSGYALVERGSIGKGREVEEREAAEVWGAEPTLAECVWYMLTDGWGVGENAVCSNGSGSGMAVYGVSALNISLNLTDIPVGYSPPVGPSVYFQVNYNHREEHQPGSFSYSNLGPKWSTPWLSYIEDTPNAVDIVEQTLDQDQGGWHDLFIPEGSSGTYQRNIRDGSLIEKGGTAEAPIYTVTYGDGSQKIYSYLVDYGSQRRIFLTAVKDSAGNTVNLVYQNGRLEEIRDANNRVTRIWYDEAAPHDKRISRVEDPFGRSAHFEYDAQGRLEKITDIIGIESAFSYSHASDETFITQLDTPYGATRFHGGGAGAYILVGNTSRIRGDVPFRWIEIEDQYGARERVEFRDLPSVEYTAFYGNDITPTGLFDPPFYGLHVNTFYWNKKQYEVAKGLEATSGKFSEAYAQRSAWYTGDDNFALPFFTPEGEEVWSSRKTAIAVVMQQQAPLENPVYYTYKGQNIGEGGFGGQCLSGATYTGGPIKVGRILKDQSGYDVNQVNQYSYNQWGNVTQMSDPVGRTTLYEYAPNGIDLLSIKQRKGLAPTYSYETLATYSNYNAQHLPQSITDASGQTTSYTYNARGQVTSVTNPKGETVSYIYDGEGYPTQITTLGDGSPAGLAVTTLEYDAKKRVKAVISPDGYRVGYQYDDFDRVTRVNFPNLIVPGQPSNDYIENTYEYLDLKQTRDRLGRRTQYSYDALRRVTQVESLEDPNQKTSYTWCDCGTLEAITDAKGKTTKFEYDVMGRLVKKHWPKPLIPLGGESTFESYTYDAARSVITSRTDALGQVTTYTHTLDDKLQSVTHSNAAPGHQLASDISFVYHSVYPRLASYQDNIGTTTYTYYPVASGQLGSGQVQSINGPLGNDTISYQYDKLGRVTKRTIAGAQESVIYDKLGRVTNTTNALGTFSASYEPNTARLQSLNYPNGQVSTYNYYNTFGDNRLQSIKHSRPGPMNVQLLMSQYDYAYDDIGQLSTATEALSGQPTANYSHFYNDIGQLIERQRTQNGVTLAIQYTYDDAGNRTGVLPSSGVAKTYTYNHLNQLYSVQEGNNPPSSYSHDLNGNLLSGDLGRTYTYDSENRLCRIDYHNSGGKATRILYNGLGQFHEIEESLNGVVTSSRFYLWCGAKPCVEYDQSASTITKRFFGQGEQHVSGSTTSNYFYTKDRLGSIRQLTNQSGQLVTAYDYNAWGESYKVSGSQESAFGYAGYFKHGPSGLNLTWFRAYSPSLGRWLTRDPLGEVAGLNLYAYCFNDPINTKDSLGLLSPPLDPGVLAASVAGMFGAMNAARNTAMLSRVVAPLVFQPGVGWVMAAIVVGVGTGYVLSTMGGPASELSANCQSSMNFTQGDTGAEPVSASGSPYRTPGGPPPSPLPPLPPPPPENPRCQAIRDSYNHSLRILNVTENRIEWQNNTLKNQFENRNLTEDEIQRAEKLRELLDASRAFAQQIRGELEDLEREFKALNCSGHLPPLPPSAMP